MAFQLRDFDPLRDKAAALAFIDGSQAYEAAFEPDRRTDATVAEDYYAAMMAEVAGRQSRIFIAEVEGRAVGWGVFVVDEAQVYVVPEERTYGYIAELYVDEALRGQGVGQALIAACEDEARRLGLPHIKIGHLTANARAAAIYERAGYAPYTTERRKRL